MSRRVQVRGTDIVLTPIEFDLLDALSEHPGWVLSPSAIGRSVWRHDGSSSALIAVHVANLRKKLRLAGMADAIETVRGVGYRLTLETRTGGTHDSRPFVDRGIELRALADALSDARAGSGSIMLLTGEPGIGKSRLVEHFCQGSGDTVVSSVGCDAAEAEPCWVWSRLLQGLLSQMRTLTHPSEPSAASEYLMRRDGDRRVVPMDSSGLDLRSIQTALVGLLRTATREATTLLVIEDAGWADSSSLALLESLAGPISRLRTLIILTARDTLASDDPGVHEVLLRLSANSRIRRLQLSPFTSGETLELARAITPEISEPLTSSIHDLSGGNPLFVTEALRVVSRRAREEAGQDELMADLTRDPSLRSVVLHRLEQVSGPTRELLEAASVLGTRFRIVLLGQMTEVTAAQTPSVLQPALDENIVEQTDDPHTFAFRHRIFRDALYEHIPAASRMRLHEKAARALESRRTDISDPTEIAEHMYRAVGLGLETEAVDYLVAAGSYAMQRFNFGQAVSEISRASMLRPSAGLYEMLGDALVPSGRPRDAIDAYRQAIEAAGPSEELRRAALYAKTAGAAIEARSWDEAALATEHGKASLGAPSDERDSEWWHAWIDLELQELWLAYYSGAGMDVTETDRWRRQMLRLSSPAQQVSFYRCRYLDHLRRTAHVPGDEGERLARLQWEAARCIDSPVERMVAEGMYASALLWHGTMRDARDHLHEGLSLARNLGNVSFQMMLLGNLSTADRLEGLVLECETHAREIIELAGVGSWPDHTGGARGQLAWCAWRRGQADLATQLAVEALVDLGRAPGFPFRWLALWPLIAVLVASDPDAAWDRIPGLLEPSQQAVAADVLGEIHAALASRESGQTTRARRHLGRALELGRRYGYT